MHLIKRIFGLLLLVLTSHSVWANLNDELHAIRTMTEANEISLSPETLSALSQAKKESLEYSGFIQSLRKELPQQQKTGGKPADGAILLVSFSMPEALLLEMASEADAWNIPVVIKGLMDGDFQATFNKVLELQEHAKKEGRTLPGISIDPIWFEQFEVTAVPALVVTERPSSCEYQKNCPNQPYDKVVGNVSIRKALEVIAERGQEVPHLARYFLEKGRV